MVRELKDDVEHFKQEVRLFKLSVTETFKISNRNLFANSIKTSKVEDKFKKFETKYKEFQQL